MPRGLALACLGLSLLAAGPATARGDGPAGGGGGRGDASILRSAKAEQARPAFLLRRTAVVTTTPVRFAATPAPAACGSAARKGASRCRGQSVNWGGWARGLPPALNVQARECPSGTMATLAEGHDDIVRCLPI